jgi:purine-binding chemotaxis protein CheW
MAQEQLVAFQLKNEEYAVSITQVKEIIRYGGATKLPNTPEHLEGIINLRGKVIPVIDLAKRFGLVQDKTAGLQAIIVESSGRELGMIVDQVTEVLRIEDSTIEVTPATCHAGNFLRGVGKLEDRLLIVLDLDNLFSEQEQQSLTSVS